MENLRLAIISLLDDEHGVSEDSFNYLVVIIEENKWNDILDRIQDNNGRFWLGEDDAEDLRVK